MFGVFVSSNAAATDVVSREIVARRADAIVVAPPAERVPPGYDLWRTIRARALSVYLYGRSDEPGLCHPA